MYNLFFINSPLQLLGSIEAIEQFETKRNVLIIFNKGRGKTLVQIKNILSEYSSKFDKLEYIEGELSSVKGWLKRFANINSLTTDFAEIDKLFIGDYRSGLVRHFANSVSYNELILMDDGFATLGIRESLKKSGLTNYKDWIKFILTLGKYKCRVEKGISYFTIFDKYIQDKCVYSNNFNSFYDEEKWVYEDTIYWLGSPVVENGKINQKDYLKIIEKVIDNFGKEQIIYFPHRKESAEKLDILEDLNNLKIKEIELPIELYVTKNKKLPQAVISLHSTALITLNRILKKTDTYYIKLDEKKFKKSDKIREARYSVLDKELKRYVI